MNQKNTSELNPNVSADCVIFGFDSNSLKVLLIDRSEQTQSQGQRLALPGDLIYDDENLDQAASRILKELTGLSEIYLEQVGAFGDPGRINKESDKAWLKSIRAQPHARVITVAYYSLVKLDDYRPQASSFAKDAGWYLLEETGELAFDHLDILRSSLQRLKEKIKVQPVGFNLLPEKFTLGQLHKLYEVILEKEIDKRNFRRKILKLDILTGLDEKQQGVAHKPSRFYRFNLINYQKLTRSGFDNFGF